MSAHSSIMRRYKWPTFAVFLVIAMITMALLPGGVSAQSSDKELAHLLIGVQGTVGVSREGWNILAQSPAIPGMSIREGDYLVFSGESRAVVLCADLTIREEFSDGVTKCSPNPSAPAFYYPDDVDWLPDTLTVAVASGSTLPEDTGAVQLVQLSADDESALSSLLGSVGGLGLDSDVEAYVVANVLARYDLYYDAINTLTQQPELQCQSADVVRPTGDSAILESPAAYLRLGEWYYFTDDMEASQRYFTCARQLALNNGDTGSAALAAARLGDVTNDQDPFQFYQEAINGFATLEADRAVSALLETCGSRNCTDPR